MDFNVFVGKYMNRIYRVVGSRVVDVLVLSFTNSGAYIDIGGFQPLVTQI